MTPRLVDLKDHGFHVDHIGLGVHDLQEGVRYVKELTGADALIIPPKPGINYQNAVIKLGAKSFLEIIAPNPLYKWPHPFNSYLGKLKVPKLVFWFLSTENLDPVRAAVERSGYKIAKERSVNHQLSTYQVMQLGPGGFKTEQPSFIHWEMSQLEEQPAETCKLLDFKLSSPDADKLNGLFRELGMQHEVEKGPSYIKIVLETKDGGSVTIENEGVELTRGLMLQIWLSMAKDLCSCSCLRS